MQNSLLSTEDCSNTGEELVSTALQLSQPRGVRGPGCQEASGMAELPRNSGERRGCAAMLLSKAWNLVRAELWKIKPFPPQRSAGMPAGGKGSITHSHFREWRFGYLLIKGALSNDEPP